MSDMGDEEFMQIFKQFYPEVEFIDVTPKRTAEETLVDEKKKEEEGR